MLGVFLYAPCTIKHLQNVQPVEQKLGIKYTETGWKYYLNDVEIYHETHTEDSILLKDPRVAMYIVNVRKDGSMVRGYFRDLNVY